MQDKAFDFDCVKMIFSLVTLLGLLLVTLHSEAQQCKNLFQNEIANYSRNKTPSDSPPPVPTSSGWNREHLRVITFNAEDFTLFEKIDPKNNRVKPKSEKHVKAIAKNLFSNRPDIITLQEIGSRYSLEKLASLAEKDAYEVVFIQGNDFVTGKNSSGEGYNRHIGFLIKKSLNLSHTVLANIRIPYSGSDPNRKFLFDRGLPVLTFYESGSSVPLFSVIGVHNHSIGVEGKFGDLKWKEELAMVEMIKKTQQTFGQNFPIILMGDMNQAVNSVTQLTRLKESMIDSFDDFKMPAFGVERTTQIFQRPGQLTVTARQADAVFISSPLRNRVIQAKTLPFANDDVSDHRPVMVDLDFSELLN